MSVLDPRQEDYVARMGELFSQLGHQRIAGRLLGWLLICDPPHQSATQLATVSGASKASVSINLRLLVAAGLVERTGVPGQRRTHYQLRPAAWTLDLRAKLAQTAELRRLADEGLDLLKDAPAIRRERLGAMRDFYAFMERELPAVIDKWLASQPSKGEF